MRMKWIWCWLLDLFHIKCVKLGWGLHETINEWMTPAAGSWLSKTKWHPLQRGSRMEQGSTIMPLILTFSLSLANEDLSRYGLLFLLLALLIFILIVVVIIIVIAELEINCDQFHYWFWDCISGSVQDCNNSTGNTLKIPQSSSKQNHQYVIQQATQVDIFVFSCHLSAWKTGTCPRGRTSMQ